MMKFKTEIAPVLVFIGLVLTTLVAIKTQSVFWGGVFFFTAFNFCEALFYGTEAYRTIFRSDEYIRERKQSKEKLDSPPLFSLLYWELHLYLDETRFGWIGAERIRNIIMLITMSGLTVLPLWYVYHYFFGP